MTSLLLHIGDSTINGWRNGDILCAYREYDSLRVYAEMIIRRRKVDVGNNLFKLQKEYQKITKDKNIAIPTEFDLNKWWDLTGLNKNNFKDFPFSKLERSKFLVVVLNRDISIEEKSLWSGKQHNIKEIDIIQQTEIIIGSHKPKYIDWQTDIINQSLAEIKQSRIIATLNDVLNPNIEIRVKNTISDRIVRNRI